MKKAVKLLKENTMKSMKQLLVLMTVTFVGQMTPAQYYVPQQQNYNRFMNQYRGREHQIITANNMINMDWARGAVNALRQDGYKQNEDIALFLWQNIGNVVNSAANLPANRNNVEGFKSRIWQSLERIVNEVNAQYYAQPVKNAPVYNQPKPQPRPSAPVIKQVPANPLMVFRGKVVELINNNYTEQLKEFSEQTTSTKVTFNAKGKENKFKNIIQQIVREARRIPRDQSLTQREVDTAITLEILNHFSKGSHYYVVNESELMTLIENSIKEMK